MNIGILLFLSWIIPIICFFIAVYCSMDKGESLEEFVNKNDINNALAFIFVFTPIINTTSLFVVIIIRFFFFIYSLIKDWRK